MNSRHELVNWDGAAGLTIDEAIDWLSHCHHSQQVSQNQVNKDVFLQHVVRRFRWVFTLAGGQDRIVIAFFKNDYNSWRPILNTIRPTSAEENAVTLDLFSWTNVANVDGSLLDKVRRLFKVTLSISIYILNELFHSINICILARGSGQSGCGEISATSFRFWDLPKGGRWYTAADHDSKKILNNGVKVQRNPLCSK